MASDFSDILGGRSLEKGNSNEASFFKVTGIVTLTLFAWIACSRVRVIFIKWKETRYKKAMRRRHGIPDEDERPFNVAYAAALRAREQGDSAPGGRRSRNALAEGQQSLRQRFNDVAPQIDTTSHWQTVNMPIIPQIAHAYAQIKQQQQNHVQTDPLDFGTRYNPDTLTVHVTNSDAGGTSLGAPALSQQASKQKVHGITEHVRKRSIGEDEDEFEPIKKSRVEGEELIDGDEDAAWAFKRGSKRGLAVDDDDEGYESTRGDKRPRNAPRDTTYENQAAEDNEMDMDEITDLKPIPRGRKRDRAEAGSTFGGDDDDELDPLDEKPSRSRKRKMLSKRKSDAQPQLRGKKRERDVDCVSEDEEDLKRSANSRRRRQMKNGDEDEEGSDESLNESLISRGSYVKGRKIGEEWEVNGILYKVGINGQRLRQALVKKARNRFPMPKDSQHPDREVNLEVYVETWLTEDEYKEAKERHELAWQDTPKASAEPEADGDVHDSPSVKGKNLLWASSPEAAVQESPALKRRPFRESIATDLGLRINPFLDSQPAPRRRVVSAFAPLPPVTASESPTRKGFRMFSKWEKQDLEAEAMAKMRAKLQEQKKPTSDAKSIGLGAPPLVASASAPSVGSTASFFAKFADKPGPTPVSASLSFGALPSSGESSKPADPGKPSIFPLSSAPSNSGSNTLFGKPSGDSSSSSTFTPAFGSQSNTSGPTATAAESSGSSNIPNFFAKKASATSAPSSTLAPSNTPTSQLAQPSPAPKVPVFGFSAPINVTPGGSNTSASSSFFSKQASKASPSVFGDVQTDSKKAEPAKPAQTSEGSGSTSLLGRMGGFAAPQNTSALPSFAPADSESQFAFGKTDKLSTEPTKSTSVFGSLGSAAETAKPTSIFGSSNAASEPAKPTSIFGSSSTMSESAKPTSVFGSSNTTSEPAKPTSVFGSSNTASEPAKPTSVFGSSNAEPTKTASAPAKSTSIFGNASTQQTPLTAPAAAAVQTPKFNFGFSNKPASSALSSTANAESPKPAESAFGFSAPKASASSTTESSGATATAPKFKFGVTGGGSTFGSASSLGGTTSTSPVTKSAFSGFASGSGASNPFSTTPAASPDQAAKSTFSFGNGGSTNKLTEPLKSSSAFGGLPSSTTPSTTLSTSATPSDPPANSTASFSFGFGNTSSTSKSTAPSPFGTQASATAGSNTRTQSVFGKTSTPTPSAFGFGNNTSSSSGAFGGFSQPEQNQQEKK